MPPKKKPKAAKGKQPKGGAGAFALLPVGDATPEQWIVQWTDSKKLTLAEPNDDVDEETEGDVANVDIRPVYKLSEINITSNGSRLYNYKAMMNLMNQLSCEELRLLIRHMNFYPRWPATHDSVWKTLDSKDTRGAVSTVLDGESAPTERADLFFELRNPHFVPPACMARVPHSQLVFMAASFAEMYAFPENLTTEALRPWEIERDGANNAIVVKSQRLPNLFPSFTKLFGPNSSPSVTTTWSWRLPFQTASTMTTVQSYEKEYIYLLLLMARTAKHKQVFDESYTKYFDTKRCVEPTCLKPQFGKQIHSDCLPGFRKTQGQCKWLIDADLMIDCVAWEEDLAAREEQQLKASGDEQTKRELAEERMLFELQCKNTSLLNDINFANERERGLAVKMVKGFQNDMVENLYQVLAPEDDNANECAMFDAAELMKYVAQIEAKAKDDARYKNSWLFVQFMLKAKGAMQQMWNFTKRAAGVGKDAAGWVWNSRPMTWFRATLTFFFRQPLIVRFIVRALHLMKHIALTYVGYALEQTGFLMVLEEELKKANADFHERAKKAKEQKDKENEFHLREEAIHEQPEADEKDNPRLFGQVWSAIKDPLSWFGSTGMNALNKKLNDTLSSVQDGAVADMTVDSGVQAMVTTWVLKQGLMGAIMRVIENSDNKLVRSVEEHLRRTKEAHSTATDANLLAQAYTAYWTVRTAHMISWLTLTALTGKVTAAGLGKLNTLANFLGVSVPAVPANKVLNYVADMDIPSGAIKGINWVYHTVLQKGQLGAKLSQLGESVGMHTENLVATVIDMITSNGLFQSVLDLWQGMLSTLGSLPFFGGLVLAIGTVTIGVVKLCGLQMFETLLKGYMFMDNVVQVLDLFNPEPVFVAMGLGAKYPMVNLHMKHGARIAYTYAHSMTPFVNLESVRSAWMSFHGSVAAAQLTQHAFANGGLASLMGGGAGAAAAGLAKAAYQSTQRNASTLVSRSFWRNDLYLNEHTETDQLLKALGLPVDKQQGFARVPSKTTSKYERQEVQIQWLSTDTPQFILRDNVELYTKAIEKAFKLAQSDRLRPTKKQALVRDIQASLAHFGDLSQHPELMIVRDTLAIPSDEEE